jgi:CheY-specific phosphatase CheX
VDRQVFDLFIEAVRQILAENGVAIDAESPESPAETPDQVITSVGIAGDLYGIFMLRIDSESAAAILRAMLQGLSVDLRIDRLGELEMGALAELSNQISGRAITLLSALDLSCDITPPAVIVAHRLQSLAPDLAESARRTISGPFGKLTVSLGVQSRKN